MLKKFPAREIITTKMHDFQNGNCSPEHIATWARSFIDDDSISFIDGPDWEAMESLSMLDSKLDPTVDKRTYLFGIIDVKQWLENLEKS